MFLNLIFCGNIFYVVQEFELYASQCFDQFISCFYVQMAHARKISQRLLPSIILDCLKKEITKRKHHKAKKLYTPQGPEHGGPSAKIQCVYIKFLVQKLYLIFSLRMKFQNWSALVLCKSKFSIHV